MNGIKNFQTTEYGVEIMKREILLQYFDKYADEVEQKINYGIEKYRKGNFTILSNGEKIKQIRLTQKTHDFQFGCNAFMLESFESREKEQLYKEKFAKVFNLAVVPFYWSDLEPEEGKLRFHKDSENIYRRPAPDIVLDFCNDYGIEPKGHCLLWNNFLPDWLYKYSEEDKKRLIEKHFKEIAEEYSDKIPSFDVINESATNYWFGTQKLFEGYDEFALDMGAKYFKNNEKIVNETNEAVWQSFYTGKYNPFNAQLKSFVEKGKQFDNIGIQYHMFATDQTFNNPYYIQGFLNPKVHFDILERLNDYGKPMNISEITIPSMFESNPENEAIQAELLEKLYSLWFSIENMKGIVWWNLVDGYAAYCKPNTNEGENRYGGGLLHYDMSEKPAYSVLDKLVNQKWKTNVTLSDGKSTFRGFYGKYTAEITYENGKTKTCEFHFNKDSTTAVIP